MAGNQPLKRPENPAQPAYIKLITHKSAELEERGLSDPTSEGNRRDVRIREGASAADVSLVIGEPVPADVSLGDQVVGGSVNGTGTLPVQVAATGAEGFLAQVVRHVEDARALKPGSGFKRSLHHQPFEWC